jgi:hypothetical protein
MPHVIVFRLLPSTQFVVECELGTWVLKDFSLAHVEISIEGNRRVKQRLVPNTQFCEGDVTGRCIRIERVADARDLVWQFVNERRNGEL